MNLEKLLEKQEELNDILQSYLGDLEVTIDKIAGTVPEALDRELDVQKKPNGILEELFSAQEKLKQKIYKIDHLKQRLDSSVYNHGLKIEAYQNDTYK